METTFNSIDIAVISIIIASGIIGVIRGITREILGLASWVCAGLFAYLSFPFFRTFARGQIPNPVIADWATIIILFIIALAVFSLVSYILAGYIRNSALGGIDRSVGLLFGFARGFFVLCLLEIAISTLSERAEQPAIIQSSRFVPLIRKSSDQILAVLPNSFLDFISSNKEILMGHTSSRSPHPATPTRLNPAAPTHHKAPQETPQPQESQKTVDALSRLKPQSNQSAKSADTYSQTQQRDMDRLFQTYEEEPQEKPAQ